MAASGLGEGSPLQELTAAQNSPSPGAWPQDPHTSPLCLQLRRHQPQDGPTGSPETRLPPRVPHIPGAVQQAQRSEATPTVPMEQGCGGAGRELRPVASEAALSAKDRAAGGWGLSQVQGSCRELLSGTEYLAASGRCRSESTPPRSGNPPPRPPPQPRPPPCRWWGACSSGPRLLRAGHLLNTEQVDLNLRQGLLFCTALTQSRVGGAPRSRCRGKRARLRAPVHTGSPLPAPVSPPASCPPRRPEHNSHLHFSADGGENL